MSSRTATGRRRLEDPTRQPVARGFFSRTKPPLPQVTAASFPSPPRSDLNLHHYGIDQSHVSNPQRIPFDLRNEYPPQPTEPFGAPRPHSTHTFSQVTPTAVRKKPVPYPSLGEEPYNTHEMNQDAPPTHASLFPTSQIPTISAVVIEASYQPPPPIHSRSDGQRGNLNKLLASPPPPERFASLPPLPSYPPPSPVVRPFPSRPHSPTPTELPAYAFPIEPSPQVSIGRPVPKNPASDPSSGRYLQPLVPPQQGAGFHSSRENLAQSPASPSTDSQSSVSDSGRRPWFRDLRTPQPTSSAPISPISGTSHLLPPSLLRQSPRSPGSLSGSSGSSGSSVLSNGTPAPFVFPGSRSVARPKAANKDNARSKSRRRKDSNHLPSDPTEIDLEVPQRPYGVVVSAPSRSVINITSTARPSPPPSVISSDGQSAMHSAFSDDDGVPPRTRSIGDTSSSDPPKAFVFPTSRSRAQPKKQTKAKNLARKRSRKFSSNTQESGSSEPDRKTFMNKFLKRKKSKASISSDSNTISSGSESLSDRNGEMDAPQEISPAERPTHSRHRPGPSPTMLDTESGERARRAKSRIGSYPLDPYDKVLLDNDRHTGELLFRLNPTGSPTFHHYGTIPPSSVLDLGCGQGHWVIDAAIAWKGHGTKVTGYDMVDIAKGLLPWAAKQGVKENVRFVRGNFLKQRLPFSDDSFELVRMSCLSLCVTSESWIVLLQEVYRVLMVGGRLELIDDEIVFPYGKATSTVDVAGTLPDLGPPQLDISIPSSSFSTYSIYDGKISNPGLGGLDEQSAPDIYGLYGVEEEEDIDDDTATIQGEVEVHSVGRRNRPGISYRAWDQAYATSRDLEALFDHMLVHKFGIHKDAHEFILKLMQEAFGHAREVTRMHLTLASPDSDGDDEDDEEEEEEPRGGRQSAGGSEFMAGHTSRSSSISHRHSMGLSQTRGLVLWPSTFLPMEQSEIEIHASKHLRMLLSCKNLLKEHALEATDDEEIDEDSVMEALWEYEGFLRHRLIAPPFDSSSSDLTDTSSFRGSIAESVRDAMWEIQSEFCQRFAWPTNRSGSLERHPQTPTPPAGQATVPRPLPYPSTTTAIPNPSSVCTRDRRETALSSATAAPLYSRNEMTHVRTFRVYEAIKIDESVFGTAI